MNSIEININKRFDLPLLLSCFFSFVIFQLSSSFCLSRPPPLNTMTSSTLCSNKYLSYRVPLRHGLHVRLSRPISRIFSKKTMAVTRPHRLLMHNSKSVRHRHRLLYNCGSFFHLCLFLSKIVLFRSSTALLIRSTTFSSGSRSSSSCRSSPFALVQARSFRPALHGVHRLRTATNSNNNMSSSASTTRTAAASSTTTTSTTPSSTTIADDNSNNNKLPPTTIPPIARREEDRVVLAGIAPPDWKKDLPRQSESSSRNLEALLDPPVPVPDPYGWMRDEKRENVEILQHLKLENAYTEGLTQHLQGLRETLYQEMLAAIQETDYTVPRPLQDWYYYTRTFQGKSYTVHCRAPKQKQQQQSEEDAILAKMKSWDGTAETSILEGEQVILDVNELAKDKPYCATGAVKRSPSHKLLAYSTDFSGDETCQLFVKDLETGEMVDHDEKLEISGSIVWAATDDALFYLKMDDAHRPFQLYKRTLSNDDDDKPDELLLEEKDELFWMGMSKSLDGKYLLVECSSKETSEYHFLDLTDPTASLQCIAKRRSKVLYDVEHRNGKWWIQSNVGGLPNMALWTAPAVADCQDTWNLVTDASTGKVLFEGGYDRSLDYVSCFKNHIVASGREGGLPRVWIARVGDDDDDDHDSAAAAAVAVQSFEMLDFAEEAYDAGLGTNLEFDTNKVVVAYDSLVTPTQSLEIALDDTSQRTVLKERAVPGYNRMEYACDRITVQSRDGSTQIPVSLVYRKDVMEQNLQKGEPVHVHLYGYGSYGSTVEADFRSTRLPLLNRGIVYVIAHVRGGGEMGRQWYVIRAQCTKKRPKGAASRKKIHSTHHRVSFQLTLFLLSLTPGMRSQMVPNIFAKRTHSTILLMWLVGWCMSES